MKKITFLIICIFLFFKLNAQLNCTTSKYNYTGYCFEYHPNGKIAAVKEFKNGLPTGIWMRFDAEGKLIEQINTRTTTVIQDEKTPIIEEVEIKTMQFGSEHTIDSDASFGSWGDVAMPIEEVVTDENKVYDFVEEEAQFPGGIVKLKEWLKTNLVYPETAKENELMGKVYMKFVVELDGSITNAVLLKGIRDCPDCDKEALRLMKAMPKWNPGKNKGKAVRSYFTIPIAFRLD